MDLSVIIISSPFASMPSLGIINFTIQSMELLPQLHDVPIFILLDGYEVSDESRFKKGRISSEEIRLYDEYFLALQVKYGNNSRFRILRNEEHLGFAFMVKWGLEICNTKYCLVSQHDRHFQERFDRLPELIQTMEEHEHIRYIGFPTVGNIAHDRLLICQYKLPCLNKSNVKMTLNDNLYLQPLIFWYDSQHLAHVERYLQIFSPLTTMPADLKRKVGYDNLKKMVLKPGHFIEDRFGQAQRNLFVSWSNEHRSEVDIIELFRWFGSYLCWISEDADPYLDNKVLGQSVAHVMVSHLHGRSLDFETMIQAADVHGDQTIVSERKRQLLDFYREEIQSEQRNNEAAVITFTSTAEESIETSGLNGKLEGEFCKER